MAHNSKVWAVAPVDGVDALTAAEAAALDLGQFKSINGDDGGTWAPGATIIIGGAGIQFNKALFQTRIVTAAYTLDASGVDFILAVDTTTGPAFNVQLTAPTVNRVVKIKHYKGALTLGVVPNGTNTIEGLNAQYALNQIGSGITLVGISTTEWIITEKV